MLSANVTQVRPWQYDPKEWTNIKRQETKDNLLLLDWEQLDADVESMSIYCVILVIFKLGVKCVDGAMFWVEHLVLH